MKISCVVEAAQWRLLLPYLNGTVSKSFPLVNTDVPYSSYMVEWIVKGLKARYPYIEIGKIASLNELDDDILKELKIKELSNEFNIDESIIRGKIKKSITKPKIVSKQEIKKNRARKIAEWIFKYQKLA